MMSSASAAPSQEPTQPQRKLNQGERPSGRSEPTSRPQDSMPANASGTPMPIPLAAGERTAAKTTDAAPLHAGDAAPVCRTDAASCAAPRRPCVQPRSVLPRSREAHGCAVRSRDTARASVSWRRWMWRALRTAGSGSCARRSAVERRRPPAGRDMRLEPANLPRRAVHSQTHPPSTADHTAALQSKQEEPARSKGPRPSTMSQVKGVVHFW